MLLLLLLPVVGHCSLLFAVDVTVAVGAAVLLSLLLAAVVTAPVAAVAVVAVVFLLLLVYWQSFVFLICDWKQ